MTTRSKQKNIAKFIIIIYATLFIVALGFCSHYWWLDKFAITNLNLRLFALFLQVASFLILSFANLLCNFYGKQDRKWIYLVISSILLTTGIVMSFIFIKEKLYFGNTILLVIILISAYANHYYLFFNPSFRQPKKILIISITASWILALIYHLYKYTF